MTASSEKTFARAKAHLADGVSAATRFHAGLGHPLYIRSATGAIVTDIDGNELVDLCMSNGAAIFGHAWTHEDPSDGGDFWGYESPLAVELAEMVSRLYPAAELMRICLSGSEAVAHSIRIARALTGRRRILKFAGHFHGNVDPLQVNWHDCGESLDASGACPLHSEMPGVSSYLREEVTVAPYNEPDALQRIFEAFGSDLAAVILEPVAINAGCVKPVPGLLERIRQLTSNHGVLLVFDEILSGFRTALGGAQELFGVCPDLVLLGKVIGGGWPLSIVAGRAEFMRQVCRGGYFLSGTHAGSHRLIQRAIRGLRVVQEDGVLEEIGTRCTSFLNTLSRRLAQHNITARIEQSRDRFSIWFGNAPDVPIVRPIWTARSENDLMRFTRLAHRHGVFMRPQAHHGISFAHSKEILSMVIDRLDSTMRDFMKEAQL